VHDVPPCLELVRALVLVFEIIRVLPNVAADNRLAFATGDGFSHERIVLVRGRNDLQFAAVGNKPRPAAAETTDARCVEFALKVCERTERGLDVVAEFARRRAPGFWRHELPEERVVPMAAGVVAH